MADLTLHWEAAAPGVRKLYEGLSTFASAESR